MSEPKSMPRGGMRLSEALDNMQLAYNPITKQLHFVSPKVEKNVELCEDVDRLSKKSSFSDEGNYSISTCEKSDTSDSPKSTLEWGSGPGPAPGHQRGKDGGSFSSTVSSLSECSLGSGASREDDLDLPAPDHDQAKLKKKGISGFFSRGVFPWKSSSKSQQEQPSSGTGSTWRLFGSKSNSALTGNTGAAGAESAGSAAGSGGSAGSTPRHHRRQGSSASEKQFDDLVASSIALIQHERPSNLPAKCEEEATRHRQEHARVVEAARRRVEREAATRHARALQAIRHEERLARHAREWAALLPRWQHVKKSKRTLELWWSGLPPSVRGRVWQLAIENKLHITHEMYEHYVQMARQKLHEAHERRKRLKLNRKECCACRSQLKDTCACKRQQTDSQEKEICVCSSQEQETSRTEHNSSRCQGNSSFVYNKENETSRSQLNESCTCRSKQIENCSCRQQNGEVTSSNLCSHSISGLNSGIETQNKCEETSSNEKRTSKTDECISQEEKPRLSLPRNFSEQNLKSHSIEDSNNKCRCTSNPELIEYRSDYSMELIALDISRTFPHLCIFQPGGPYSEALHDLLAAYVCYRPDIGYVQGMSFIAAMLILHMEAPAAFVCFCNLLDGAVLRAAFARDGVMMQRLWSAYGRLVARHVPALAGRVAPELYLLEWLYSAFAKAMPLDAAARVWDMFLRDGDTFLFHAAIGVLHLYQEELVEMDFISAAQFLTRLPEELDPEALFRSIAAVSMSCGGLSFEELVACGDATASLHDDTALDS